MAMPETEPTYKWPAKVVRYKITCPFQRFMTAKYESIIDWNGARITSPEALDQHIREKMLPALRQRMEPASDKTCYCRTINLAHMLANPAEHIQQARTIRDRQGDDAARIFLLDHINRHKKEAFEAWWNYLTRGNPVYARQPAFQYLMLRPVMESSDARNTRSPIHPDAEALAHLHAGIEQGHILPSAKLLWTLCKFVAFGGLRDGDRWSNFGTACGWILVTKAMEKASDRVAALSQGNGWCVASSSMAADYLRESDFHMLLENGRTVAAIRTSGNMAVEIQGKGNSDPGPWWPRILLHLNALNIGISEPDLAFGYKGAAELSTKYRTLLESVHTPRKLAEYLKEQPAQVQFVREELSGDESFQPVVETAWLACIEADPACAALRPPWLNLPRALRAEYSDSWRQQIATSPELIANLPEELQTDSYFVANAVDLWCQGLRFNPRLINQCPPFLKTSPIIDDAFINGWANLIRGDPLLRAQCPPHLRESAIIRSALRLGRFVRAIRSDPRRWWAKLPESARNDPAIESARVEGWARIIGSHAAQWDYCPAELQAHQDITRARIDHWVSRLRNAFYGDDSWEACPVELRSNDEIRAAFRDCLTMQLYSDPSLLFPSEFDECPEIRNAIRAGYCNYIDSQANRLIRMQIQTDSGPPDIVCNIKDFNNAADLVDDPEIIASQIHAWMGLLRVYPSWCTECPPSLAHDDRLAAALLEAWLRHIGTKPEDIEICPNRLRSALSISEALKKVGYGDCRMT